VLEHRRRKVRNELRQRSDDLLKGPGWLLEVGGLALDDPRQQVRVEVEEVAQELIGVLRFDTMTCAPAFTAAAATCRSFGSFFIPAMSGS